MRRGRPAIRKTGPSMHRKLHRKHGELPLPDLPRKDNDPALPDLLQKDNDPALPDLLQKDGDPASADHGLIGICIRPLFSGGLSAASGRHIDLQKR